METHTVVEQLTSDFNVMKISEPQGTVIIIVGPIGYGKSTLGDALQKANKMFVHIDGDMLDINSIKAISRLGDERNQYTQYQIVRVLMQGKIPIISCGGGQLMTYKNHKGEFSLRSVIELMIGMKVNLITFVPNDIFTLLDKTNIPLNAYDEESYVIDAVKRRIAFGDWTVEYPKNCINESAKAKVAETFINKIVAGSKKNKDIAMKIIQESEIIFGFPRVSNGSISIESDILDILHLHVIEPIKVSNVFGNQFRLLVDVDNETFGHITCDYNIIGVSKTFEEIQHFDTFRGTFEGQIIVAKDVANPTTKELRVAIPNDPKLSGLHSNAHITLSSGIHPPVVSGNVTTAFRNGVDVTLPVPNKPDVNITYHITPMQPCILHIYGFFVIIN